MVECPYGKASICFPLSISRAAALGALDAQDEGVLSAQVVGYTTQKTFEAGASSLRVKLNYNSMAPSPGAFLVAVRAPGCQGFVPGLAAPRCGGADRNSADCGFEIIIFGRPELTWSELMYLPEEVIRKLFPADASVDVRIVKSLAPVQHDCPPQWLRDRLLRLADGVESMYSGGNADLSKLRCTLENAGLRPVQKGEEYIVPPADVGKRFGEDELGYWTEEAKLNARCGASKEGDSEQLFLPTFPGLESML